MPAYRFYYMDSVGHFAEPPIVAEFPNDRGAIEAAKALLDRKSIEVVRIIIRLDPNDGPPQLAASSS
jgi:hypothetical protein